MADSAAPNLGNFGQEGFNPIFSLSPDALNAARAAGDSLLPSDTRAQVGEAETALAAIREALNSVDDPAVRSALQSNQLELSGALAAARLSGSPAALTAINVQQMRMQADSAIAADIQNGLGDDLEGATAAYESLRTQEYAQQSEEQRYAQNYEFAAENDPFFSSYSEQQQRYIIGDTDVARRNDPEFGKTMAEITALSPEEKKSAQDERAEAYHRLEGLQQSDLANAGVIGEVMKHSHHSLTAEERVKLEAAAKGGDPNAYRELLESVQGREKHNAFAAAQTLDVGRDVAGFNPQTPEEAAGHIVYDTQDKKYDVSIDRLTQAVKEHGGDEKKAFASLSPEDQKHVYDFRLTKQVEMRGAAESVVSFAREAHKGLGLTVAEKAEFVNGTAQQNIDMMASKHGVTDPAKQRSLAAMLIPLDGKPEAKAQMLETMLDKNLSAKDRETKMAGIYETATGHKPSLSREVAYYNAVDGLAKDQYSAAGIKDQMSKAMEAGKAETAKIDMEGQLRAQGKTEEQIAATSKVEDRRTAGSQVLATQAAAMEKQASAMPAGPVRDELMKQAAVYKADAQKSGEQERGEGHYQQAGQEAWSKLTPEQQKSFGSPEKYVAEMRKIDGQTVLATKAALETGGISSSHEERIADTLDARKKFTDTRAEIYDRSAEAAQQRIAADTKEMTDRATAKADVAVKAKDAVKDLHTEVKDPTEVKAGESHAAKTAAVSADKAKEKQQAQAHA